MLYIRDEKKNLYFQVPPIVDELEEKFRVGISICLPMEQEHVVPAAAACQPAPGQSAARGARRRSCTRRTWSSASPSTHTW
jgi:hypothetical protein